MYPRYVEQNTGRYYIIDTRYHLCQFEKKKKQQQKTKTKNQNKQKQNKLSVSDNKIYQIKSKTGNFDHHIRQTRKIEIFMR